MFECVEEEGEEFLGVLLVAGCEETVFVGLEEGAGDGVGVEGGGEGVGGV